MKREGNRIKVVAISIPDRLLKEIDYRRGDIPRSRFIARIVEQFMESGEK